LLRLSTRQVRRLQRRLRKQGDAAVVHGLRGKPSNRRLDPKAKHKILRAYRKDSAAGGGGRGPGARPAPPATRTAAAGRGGPASASWCRWTPRCMTGWRAAARSWC
jgi:hypothetical protein